MVINYFSELLAIEIIPSDQKNKSTVYPILISIGDLLLEVLNNKSLPKLFNFFAIYFEKTTKLLLINILEISLSISIKHINYNEKKIKNK